LVVVLAKGVLVVPPPTRWTGPWLGATRATSLQRVANRAIVCHALDALFEAGVIEAAVLAPVEVAEEVAACVADEGPAGVEVRHLTYEQSNQAQAGEELLAATEFVGEAPCVLHRADGLLGQPLAPFLELTLEQSPEAMLLVQDDGSDVKLLRLVPERPLGPSSLDSLPAAHGFAGVCLLGPGALLRLREHDQGPGPGLDLTALARRLGRDGGPVQVRVVRKWRHFDGDALDLLDLNRTMLDMLHSEAIASDGDGNRFEGNIQIDPTACVTSSVIIGPVVIGADALIADSYIGPHTSIAERVRIEGAELERSIVLAEASVLHVGGRLVASVVGRGARVFRDFSMPRALRLQVGDGDEVALC
jgi:glucose-1-phosphate thymidylyltransferase